MVGVLGVYLLWATTPPVEPVSVILTVPGVSFRFNWAYTGIEQGIFEEEGIDLEVVISSPPPTAVQAVIAGSAQFTAVAESAATAMLQGADLRIIGYWSTDLEWLLMARSGIDDVQDLQGGKVGVSSLHSQGTVVTEEILLSQGLVPGEDVEIVAVGPPHVRVPILEQGEIDATLFFPPESVIAEGFGATALLSSGDVLERKLIAALVTSQQMIDENPDTVRRMVKATFRSVKYIVEHREQAISVAMDVMGMDQDMAQETYDFLETSWGFHPDPADVEFLFDVQNTFLDNPVDYELDDYLDYSFANDALSDLGEDPLS